MKGQARTGGGGMPEVGARMKAARLFVVVSPRSLVDRRR